MSPSVQDRVNVAVRGEVVEPGAQSLTELAEAANLAHGRVVASGTAMVYDAIRAGEALHRAEALAEPGQWMTWLRANFDGSTGTAHLYMRLADYQDQIMRDGTMGIAEAKHLLTRSGFGRRRNGPKPTYPAWMRTEAIRLRNEGMSVAAAARHLGVSNPTIVKWTNPAEHERRVAKMQAARRRNRDAARALRERQREQELKRAVRKAGAALAEAYAVAERMQDVLAQAHRETDDSQARRHLSTAGTHYRQMRDEIVRALGVAR